MKKIIVIIVFFLVMIVYQPFVFAKRLGPSVVNKVVFNGIEYSASNIEMGYVEAKTYRIIS